MAGLRAGADLARVGQEDFGPGETGLVMRWPQVRSGRRQVGRAIDKVDASDVLLATPLRSHGALGAGARVRSGIVWPASPHVRFGAFRRGQNREPVPTGISSMKSTTIRAVRIAEKPE